MVIFSIQRKKYKTEKKKLTTKKKHVTIYQSVCRKMYAKGTRSTDMIGPILLVFTFSVAIIVDVIQRSLSNVNVQEQCLSPKLTKFGLRTRNWGFDLSHSSDSC